MSRYAQNAGAKMVRTISDYASARSAARALRNGKLGNNTWVFERQDANGDSCVVIILHSTPIVTYHENGTVTLNTGGYRTVTTKARMNEVLPQFIRVSQIRNEWFVYVHGEREKYYDGIRLDTGATTSHSGGAYETNRDIHIDIDSHKGEPLHENPGERLVKGVGFGRGTLVTERVWRKIDGERIKKFPAHSPLGGYPLYYIVGEPGRGRGKYDNLATVSAETINSGQLGEDDVVVDVDINYEDDDMYDDVSGEKIPAAYTENPKLRQVIFRQTGGTAYGKAQRVAFDLRSAGYEAEQGSIPSSAGSWADSVYVMTNAPLGAIRKAATQEGLEVQR